jgi:uncharacterized protein YjeT (DUF2065 family)
MAWDDLFAALALYLVIEGIVPFASPGGWRKGVEYLRQIGDGALRLLGLGLMIVGLILLLLVRGAA